MYWADAEGYFEREGLKLKYEVGGVGSTAAFAAGKTDFILTSIGSLFGNVDAGQDLKVILNDNKGSDAYVITGKPEIEEPSDCKTIITGPDGTSQNAWAVALNRVRHPVGASRRTLRERGRGHRRRQFTGSRSPRTNHLCPHAPCPRKPSRQASGLGALSDDGIGAALRAMHSDVARRWPLQELAGISCMSRSAFAAAFKKQVGTTPLDYLIEWRMSLARDALRRGTRSISELAFAIGYESDSAFSTAFRRVVGSSPKQFRDSAVAVRMTG